MQTAMCDRAGASFQRMSWASNQMYASSMQQVTFYCFVLSNATGNVQLCCVSGIAAASVEQFAMRIQHLLVQYLRACYGDDTANWCERFWTGDHGRRCLFIAGMWDATTRWVSK